MWRIVLVVMSLLWFKPALAGAILVYGDSLSAGYGLPRDRAWPALLAGRLAQERLDYTVANARISGETSVGGARRIAATLDKHKPSIVILALGANDGLRGLSLEATRANLDSIITASLKNKASVVLVGMRLPPNYGAPYTEKFRLMYSELAKKHRLPPAPFLLEGFADATEWFQADGMHPTIKAQPVMLETVWKALHPALLDANKTIKKQ